MKKSLSLLAFILCAGLWSAAQANRPADLQTVLNLMDRTASTLRTVETDFTWDDYERVVDTHDYQKGVMYFSRSGKGSKDVEMSAQITQPAPKFVLFKASMVHVYEPRIDQVTIYNVGKNKADFEAFLVLGFGGASSELAKNFTVRYAGSEQVAGVKAYKLELVPKSASARNNFPLITLWIDADQGIAVQQRFDQGGGNYRLAQYSNIKRNQKLPEGVFTLKTTGKTRTVRPQGG
ncbi:MAG: outer-membrane lipoprotein carrier protein LolA [Candidatus Korobacteraceae bacterium]